MLSGYLTYTLMWVWIGRTLFLYHYMPAVYLGFLALAVVLAGSLVASPRHPARSG